MAHWPHGAVPGGAARINLRAALAVAARGTTPATPLRASYRLPAITFYLDSPSTHCNTVAS